MATNVTLAPLLIKRDVHECLKLLILIRFNPALFTVLERYKYRVKSAIGLQTEQTKRSSSKFEIVFLSCSYNSDNDGRITSILFTGLKNRVFNSSKFDSEPELVLARQLERKTDFVKLWLRPNINEFNITYDNGKKYEPD